MPVRGALGGRLAISCRALESSLRSCTKVWCRDCLAQRGITGETAIAKNCQVTKLADSKERKWPQWKAKRRP